MTPTIWEECYDDRWSGFITNASHAHPAKFSKKLIERIFDHCLAQGYLRRGDLVGDPFGGVATGGIVAAYRGLRWIGVELEPKFVALALENIWLHADKLEQLGFPKPEIMQGDSRKFHEAVDAVITSPPYAANEKSDYKMSEDGKTRARDLKRGFRQGHGSFRGSESYGETEGQIGRLRSSSLDAVVSSPPYADSVHDGNGIDRSKLTGNPAGRNSQAFAQGYGASNGQIGALHSGALDAVVSSPPWEKNCEGKRGKHKFKDATAILKCNRGHGASDAAVLAQAERDEQKIYGESPGQIGKEAGETYWQAMAAVYASCYQSIKPGGVICIVVKDYCKKGRRVPLCDDTARLLEHTGFTVVERVRAMLVAEQRHADLFTGETVTKKSRKSFFRRLCEAKGSPKIDFEEVIIAVK